MLANNSASPGVQLILQTLISSESVGIMIPIPQYPLYTASIALFGGKAVPYYLEEENGWGLSVTELADRITTAKNKGLDVRALCIINPGNPTGQCLTEANIEEIINFAEKEHLIILADEVYQMNSYEKQEKPFVSFKKVLSRMSSPVQLISFHSVSKGMTGECGRRGGYFECINIDQAVLDTFYKLASISLCPPVDGQVMVDLMVNPPQQGQESFELYSRQIDGIYESLKKRAAKLHEAFNSMEGMTCNPANGAMYLFPKIELPHGAIKEAKTQNRSPDELYCMELLENTGVCMVPGSGFGQKEHTLHFRSTFLPAEDKIDQFINNFRHFHANFMKKYSK